MVGLKSQLNTWNALGFGILDNKSKLGFFRVSLSLFSGSWLHLKLTLLHNFAQKQQEVKMLSVKQ